MGYYDYGFKPYVPVGKRKEIARKKMEQLKKKNPNLAPVIIEGNKIAESWWGISWNKNLERYSDYANRIGRGRSYVRQGAILDLQITKGKITALVQGSRPSPYEIDISIKPLSKDNWDAIRTKCEGKMESLASLLEGEFPKALGEIFTEKGRGLFPEPKEIKFKCSCPDWASMCKHIAATLFGVGARLDVDPLLFFILRNSDVNDLVSQAVMEKSKKMIKKSETKSKRVIEDADVSEMFGINVEPEKGKKRKSKK